jgi:hypothetical protein
VNAGDVSHRHCSALEELSRIGRFRLSLGVVHEPEQVGEMGRVDARHLPDRLARRLGALHLGVEGAVLDGYERSHEQITRYSADAWVWLRRAAHMARTTPSGSATSTIS